MRRRRGPGKRNKIWVWISFVLFALIITLLTFSVVQKKSPARVLKDTFSKAKVEGRLDSYSKKDLIALVESKDSVIGVLNDRIEEYIHAGGFQKAMVNVESESLNMRSSPSLTSEILLRIPNRSLVNVLYYDQEIYYLNGEEGKWCKIEYADESGWVWANFLQDFNLN